MTNVVTHVAPYVARNKWLGLYLLMIFLLFFAWVMQSIALWIKTLHEKTTTIKITSIPHYWWFSWWGKYSLHFRLRTLFTFLLVLLRGLDIFVFTIFCNMSKFLTTETLDIYWHGFQAMESNQASHYGYNGFSWCMHFSNIFFWLPILLMVLKKM